MRALTAILWVLLAAHTLWLAVHIHAEMTAEIHVAGPVRAWNPPYDTPDGPVVDPRPGDLLTEIRDRLRPNEPLPAPPTELGDPAAWRPALEALRIPVAEARGPGDGGHPRLVFGPRGPWLVVGLHGGDPVAFDPTRGVVLVEDPAVLPAGAPALEIGEREAPW